MSESLPVLVENAVQIAWDVLERSGEITNPAFASQVLVQTIAQLAVNGERRRLMLVNRGIDSYRKHKRAAAA